MERLLGVAISIRIPCEANFVGKLVKRAKDGSL